MFNKRYSWKKSRMTFDPNKNLAHTEFKRECDINNIVEQYVTTGTLPNTGRKAFVKRYPMFGDFSVGNDFQTAQNTLKAHENAFMELPSRLRERFRNDPQNLIHFLANPANFEEAVKLGLMEKEAVKLDPVIEPVSTPITPTNGVIGDGDGTVAQSATE